MKMNKVVQTAAMIALMAFGHAAGATEFFVDCKNGDDGFDGKSAGQPEKTIQAAIDVAADGDTVNVAAACRHDIGIIDAMGWKDVD